MTFRFDMRRIGQTIAGLRRQHNMTQMALADAMGVSFQAVSNWERGVSIVKGTPPTTHAYTACSQHEKENKHMKLITCEFNMDRGHIKNNLIMGESCIKH